MNTPRKQCVVGFAFYGDRVVLIIKAKPEWQKNKVNGVGGKVEPGELPSYAMAREFREETGVASQPSQWELFSVLRFPKAEIFFFRADLPEAVQADTQFIQPVEVIIHPWVAVPNLRWLIPLARDREAGREVVQINYTE